MARVHKDLRDLAAEARNHGAELALHGTYFSVLKDGREVARLAVGGQKSVPRSERNQLTRALARAGLLDTELNGGAVYSPADGRSRRDHGTQEIIAAGGRSRTPGRQEDGSGLMAVAQVVRILREAVEKTSRGGTNRGGLMKVTRDAIETARFRNLPPPSSKATTVDPWDADRIADVLRHFLKSEGGGTKRSEQFWRAHAEQLTDRLDTFVDVTGAPVDVPVIDRKTGKAVPMPPEPEPELSDDEPHAALQRGLSHDTGALTYDETVPLPATITLGDALALRERVREVGSALFDPDGGLRIIVVAGDLWDLRELLIVVERTLSDYLVEWQPSREGVRS